MAKKFLNAAAVLSSFKRVMYSFFGGLSLILILGDQFSLPEGSLLEVRQLDETRKTQFKTTHSLLEILPKTTFQYRGLFLGHYLSKKNESLLTSIRTSVLNNVHTVPTKKFERTRGSYGAVGSRPIRLNFYFRGFIPETESKEHVKFLVLKVVARLLRHLSSGRLRGSF